MTSIPPTNSFSWPSFILALFGALAWMPIAISFYNKMREKPQLAIFLDKHLRIIQGEHNLVIDIKIGILTKVADTFIENITLTTEHSNGEKRNFKWAQTIDAMSQTLFSDTIVPTNRILSGIGYNLPKNSYTEPSVSFISPSFRERHDDLMTQLRIKSFYIQPQKGARKHIEQSDLFIGICNNYRQHFTWATGDYQGTIVIYTIDKQTFTKSFTFNIDHPNSASLFEMNYPMVEDKLRNNYSRDDDEKLTYDDTIVNIGLPIEIKPV